MSHIAEVYAKDLGVKIGTPKLTEHFYPGLPDRYITLQSSNKMPASHYFYWEVVLHLLKKFIGDIKIVQVGGGQDQLIPGVDASTLGCTYKQMNYIIKKSLTHFGCDSVPGHVASVYDVPSVILHFNLYPSNSRPIFHKNNSCISLSPDFSNIKPSFSLNGNRINEIKPETIAQSILDQLNIKQKITFKTIRIGSEFHNENVEIVPNFNGLISNLKDKPVNIRGDLHFDIQNIIDWCRFSLVNLHIKQEIPLQILQLTTNLKQVVFKYTKENHDTNLNNFFKTLKAHKINIIIACDDNDIISEVRLKYFDYNVVHIEYPKNKIKASKFLSRKKFITNKEAFASEFSSKKFDKSDNFVYDETSSKELENLYLYDE
tara:strand:- start:350 stop:1471 length:1122 start_codon:yes stop_codon:yes gene_type:complete